MTNDELGDRMKGYEKEYDVTIPKNQRVILRLDGNSFHVLTRAHFEAPFDDRFKESMHQAAISVLDYTHGVLAYVQSDEINVLLGERQEGEEILKNRVQKICSIVASTCAVTFSKAASTALGEDIAAQFDCRCFPIPRDDVINYFVWRQRDSMRNAINSIYYWKLRETMGMKAATRKAEGTRNDQKEFTLKDEFGITIDQYPVHYIRGAVAYKRQRFLRIEDLATPEIIEKYKKQGGIVTRHEWFVDKEMPVIAECGLFQSLTGIYSHEIKKKTLFSNLGSSRSR